MRTLLVFLLAGATAAIAQAPAGMQPVATTLELMKGMIEPASNALFDAGDKAPASADDWAKLRMQALLVIESGNLLLMDGRARDKDQWVKDTRAQMDAGQLALKAIAAKDVDKLVGDVGTAIVQSCESCHRHYMRRAAK